MHKDEWRKKREITKNNFLYLILDSNTETPWL